ncbi:MAG TPA: PA2779 family protein [Thermoanaerobaculia bacterium]|nr:PA2779 family protein [Thermoanaerobaculia bacterium]
MHTSLRRFVLAGLGFLALVVAFAPPAQALPAPSKTDAGQALLEREADLATLDALLDNEEVSEALAAQGFTREEVNSRLAQLAPEELSALASQTEQLQAAGQPTYVWVLIAILAVVAIVAIAG